MNLIMNGQSHVLKMLIPSIKRTFHRNFAKMLSDPENKGVRQEHINFDTLGTWDNRIDFGLLLTQSIKHGKPIPKISLDNTGVATVDGRRTYNEDRYKIKEIAPDLLYLGIFDGHAGPGCADYCQLNMEKHITYWLQTGEKDLQTVLSNSFIEINNSFARHVASDKSGTTALVCLLRNSIELVVAHVGDSRMLLCRNGEVRRITTDHTAELKSEKERIIKSGGTLAQDSLGRPMVNGRLSMTRSLGDLELKKYGVIALPDTRSLEVKHGKDAFIIITTDGVNSVMSDGEIIKAVQNCVSPSEAAQFVCDTALHYACEDNATAIVVPFGAWGKYKNMRSDYNQFYSFGRELLKTNRS